MIVGDDQASSEEDSNSAEDGGNNTPRQTPRRALVSVESAELLQTAGGGSLGKWYITKIFGGHQTRTYCHCVQGCLSVNYILLNVEMVKR
jgi:hypothetical protein